MDMEKDLILYVDDLEENLSAFKFNFLKSYKILLASSAKEAVSILENTGNIKVIISDQRMPGQSGIELLELVQNKWPDIIGIVVTAYIDMDAIKDGINRARVFGYLQKPFQPHEVQTLIDHAIELYNEREKNENLLNELQDQNRVLSATTNRLQEEIIERKAAEKKLTETVTELTELKKRLQAENYILNRNINDSNQFRKIITVSAKMKKLLDEIKSIAPTNISVLIMGETGTGKELFADAVHSLSKRADKPIIKINCAALPESVIESELFGHERGAFTGAFERKKGRFEYADGGTIFLDEIGELSPDLQAKLLRVLQQGEFQRIGSNETIKVDVRIISATNRNLQEEVERKNFRSDLYFRLSVYNFSVIPLRDRLEDIPVLADYLINKFTTIHGLPHKIIDEKNLNLLKSYSWPGNVRELENIIERSVILAKSDDLNIEPGLFANPVIDNMPANDDPPENPDEKVRLRNLLEEHNWKIEGEKGVASSLGIPPSTVRYHIKKYGIKRPPRF